MTTTWRSRFLFPGRAFFESITFRESNRTLTAIRSPLLVDQRERLTGRSAASPVAPSGASACKTNPAAQPLFSRFGKGELKI